MTAETFLQELQKIILAHPRAPTKVLYSENCVYADEVYYSKDVLYGFDCAKVTNCIYVYDSFICDNCMDCDYAVESQLCYESVDPFKAYNCNFINYCANIRDSSYCERCWDSNNLFGCVDLQNKSFCIFNRQVTEAEYHEKIKYYQSWPPEKIFAIMEQIKSTMPLTQTIAAFNEKSDYGNYMHYCKKCYLCFDAAHDENCAYLYDSFNATNCIDMTYTGKQADLSYEVVSSASIFNSDYIYWSENISDSSYIFNCFDVKNSLGCVNMGHKQYCILNRQFTKEEYEKISTQILSELHSKNIGWGSLETQ